MALRPPAPWCPGEDFCSSLIGMFQSTVIRFHGFNPLGMYQLPYTWQVLNAAFQGDYHLWLNREKRGGEEKISTSPLGGEHDENCLLCCSCWACGAGGGSWASREGVPGEDQATCLSVIKRIWVMLHTWVALLCSPGARSSWCVFIEGFLLILLLQRANTLQSKWD